MVQFRHAQLENGLTIVAEVNDDAHTAAAGFFVKTGTRDEPRELMGVSHFLEHMMFKGTPRRSADDVNRDFDRIGANYNASTSQETTNYYAHVLPEYIPQAIDLLSDILRPSLRDDDFDMEKKVILEEIGMYADRPFWVIYEQAMQRYFGGHPLGYRILGTSESITALNRAQMRRYFEEHYGPDNMVVSLSGRVDFEACVDQIARQCGDWPPTQVHRTYERAEPHAVDETLRDAKVNRHYMAVLSPGPSAQDEDRYAAAVLANLLGDEDGSRLYWSLIDPGLADEAELSASPFDRTGTFMAYASCAPSNAERVEAILLRELDRAAEGLTASEVERAVNKIAMDLTLQNERPAGRMMALGGQWLYLQEYRPLQDELRRVLAVTVDDLKALAERYPFSRRTVIRLSPTGNGD